MIKEAKKNIHVTLQFLFFVLVVVSILIVDKPMFTTLFMGLWIGFLLFNLMSLIQYRLGKADFILLPTNHDQFAKVNAFVLGLLMLFLSIVSSIWFPLFDEFVPIGLAIGSLMLIGSLIAVPIGNFKVVGEKLELYGQKDAIEMQQIKEIQVYNEQLVIVPFFGEHVHVQSLNISSKDATKLLNYLSRSKKAAHIEVKVRVG